MTRNRDKLYSIKKKAHKEENRGIFLRKVFLILLGDVALQAHLVKGKLALAGGALHDGRQEALRVEEAGQPHRRRHLRATGGCAVQSNARQILLLQTALHITNHNVRTQQSPCKSNRSAYQDVSPRVEAYARTAHESGTWSRNSAAPRSSIADVIFNSP